MTAQRAAAITLWLAAAVLAIASAALETGTTDKWVWLMFIALILSRICDLEDRLKRMSDEAEAARKHIPRDVRLWAKYEEMREDPETYFKEARRRAKEKS